MEPAPELQVIPVSFASYSRLLRGNQNFRRLWSAQVVSEIGDWFYTLAIYNLLLQLTGRASSVALALVLQVLPQTFIGPTAGVVNDRLLGLATKRVRCAAVVQSQGFLHVGRIGHPYDGGVVVDRLLELAPFFVR